MTGQEGSKNEVLLFAVAVAVAACVFAAAVDKQAAASKDDVAKAGVISSLQIALSQGAQAGATGAPSLASSASAQTSDPTAPQNAAPGKTLSEKLKHSNGVIHPKEVDPGIERPAPKVGDPNVAPPPGTSGSGPAPQPK